MKFECPDQGSHTIREAAEEGIERGAFFCQLVLGKMEYPRAEVARFLGVTTSGVNRAAYSEELPELLKYL